MAIATATSLDVYVGGQLLFGDVSFKLEPGDRMTLSGRNGAGKSTLLRVLSGELAPESGTLTVQRGARVALHDQRPPRESSAKLGDYVLSGRSDMIETEAELARLEGEMSGGVSEETMNAYAAAQGRLEAGGGYRWRDDVLAVLRGLGFGPDQHDRALSTFSGGELTRASLARVLAAKPDLLLLDEPTNHLDIPSLEWLERYLVDLDAAVVLVAHDRWFLEAVGTSVLELEAQRARFFPGPWHAWRQEQAARQIALGKSIERQQAEIERMERFVERFRYKASKARQAQSRIKQIDKKKKDGPRAEVRDTRSLRFSFKPPERPGRVVLKMVDATIEVPGRTLLSDAELEVERGEHVVLVGANGSGKTTLLKLLLGELQPDSGEIRAGTQLQVAYFDQYRATLREDWNAVENVAEGRDFIEIGGRRKHVLGYLQEFLFTPERARAPITRLSGGERNRLLLARLFAQPSNLLVMDEPTNDLDVETLELLEELLADYPGTLLLVSHDRDFLDNVVTSTLVMQDGSPGHIGDYVGGYSDWLRQRAKSAIATSRLAATPVPAPVAAVVVKRKLSYKDARELEQLPLWIDMLESKLAALTEQMNDPAFYQRDSAAITTHNAAVAQAQVELDTAYARWAELERA